MQRARRAGGGAKASHSRPRMYQMLADAPLAATWPRRGIHAFPARGGKSARL